MLITPLCLDPSTRPGACLCAHPTDAFCDAPAELLLSDDPQQDFEFIAREHEAYVSSTLRRLGVKRGELERCRKDVFASFERRFNEFNSESDSIHSWLYALCRQRASMLRHRSWSRRAQPQTTMHEPSRRPKRVVSSAQLHNLLSRELATQFATQLETRRCEVFLLIDVHARSPREVADWLEVSVDTVYARLKSARRSFAHYLDRRHTVAGTGVHR